ncbi:MAG: hypothetical protein WDM81_10500 [Rhizomicrobium sp.]
MLHAVAGLPILGHVIAAIRGAGVERIVVVSAPNMESLRGYVSSLGGGERDPGQAARHRPCRAGRPPACSAGSTVRSWSTMATCRWPGRR